MLSKSEAFAASFLRGKRGKDHDAAIDGADDAHRAMRGAGDLIRLAADRKRSCARWEAPFWREVDAVAMRFSKVYGDAYTSMVDNLFPRGGSDVA